jgi:protein-L-isoaspartate(D-aspartate) O-methyltransferase
VIEMLKKYALFSLIVLAVFGAGCSAGEDEMAVEENEDEIMQKRLERMVESQIESRGVTDPAVLAAMRETPRWKFVPEDLKHRAFEDNPLPIGYDQTISQPYIVAYMTEALLLESDDRVLEIGTGSGYQAAVLAEIAAEVYTIEILPELGERAEETLTELGYENVHVLVGDGYEGWPEHAPFDAVIVTCAPDHVPEPLLEQLADGGRLVIPVGGTYPQELQRITRVGDDYETEFLTSVLFVPMTGEAEEK